MNQPQARTLFATAAITMLLAAPPALGQSMAPLLDRLDRLERDIQTLNKQNSRGPSALTTSPTDKISVPSAPIPKHAAGRLNARMDSLEQDLRSSTGGQETISHQVRQLAERFDKLVGDIDYRLGVIESRLGIGGATTGQLPAAQAPIGQSSAVQTPGVQTPGVQALGVQPQTIASAPVGAPVAAAVNTQPIAATPPGSLGTVSAKSVEAIQQARAAGQVAVVKPQVAPAPVQAAPQPAAALPAGTAKEQYTYAFNLLRQTNYDQAEIALKQFIATHGSNPLAGNARYWLGETFYVRADYQQAAQVFFDGFQADPKGGKAPDMLLKLGMSLGQLKKKNEACATFDKVAADFAKSSSRIKTALSRERKRVGCP
jgi:tol-pal system protein YbgF